MKIVIDIPEEFGNHFEGDRFEDSLQRVRFDIHKFLIRNKDMLSGNYEVETLDMLIEAFSNAAPLPKGHGRLIDADVFISNHFGNVARLVDEAPTIIEADKEND